MGVTAKQAPSEAEMSELLGQLRGLLGPDVEKQLVTGGEEGLTKRTLTRWVLRTPAGAQGLLRPTLAHCLLPLHGKALAHHSRSQVACRAEARRAQGRTRPDGPRSVAYPASATRAYSRGALKDLTAHTTAHLPRTALRFPVGDTAGGSHARKAV